jgi:hypothetical protein
MCKAHFAHGVSKTLYLDEAKGDNRLGLALGDRFDEVNVANRERVAASEVVHSSAEAPQHLHVESDFH